MTHEEFLKTYKDTIEKLNDLVDGEELKNLHDYNDDPEEFEVFVQEFNGYDFDTLKAILEAYSGTPKYSIKDLLYCIDSIYQPERYTFLKNYTWAKLAEDDYNQGSFGTIPDGLQPHIDMDDLFESIGEDMKKDSPYYEVENGLIWLQD